jgi:hypothetical protein
MNFMQIAGRVAYFALGFATAAAIFAQYLPK